MQLSLSPLKSNVSFSTDAASLVHKAELLHQFDYDLDRLIRSEKLKEKKKKKKAEQQKLSMAPHSCSPGSTSITEPGEPSFQWLECKNPGGIGASSLSNMLRSAKLAFFLLLQ